MAEQVIVLSPAERELAARCALLVARMYELHGWTWGWGDSEFVPDVESIAQTIEELIPERCWSGRLAVIESPLGLEVFLHLGGLYEGEVSVDEQLRSGPTPKPDGEKGAVTTGDD